MSIYKRIPIPSDITGYNIVNVGYSVSTVTSTDTNISLELGAAGIHILDLTGNTNTDINIEFKGLQPPKNFYIRIFSDTPKTISFSSDLVGINIEVINSVINKTSAVMNVLFDGLQYTVT